jgi:hypothetical protein
MVLCHNTPRFRPFHPSDPCSPKGSNPVSSQRNAQLPSFVTSWSRFLSLLDGLLCRNMNLACSVRRYGAIYGVESVRPIHVLGVLAQCKRSTSWRCRSWHEWASCGMGEGVSGAAAIFFLITNPHLALQLSAMKPQLSTAVLVRYELPAGWKDPVSVPCMGEYRGVTTALPASFHPCQWSHRAAHSLCRHPTKLRWQSATLPLDAAASSKHGPPLRPSRRSQCGGRCPLMRVLLLW